MRQTVMTVRLPERVVKQLHEVMEAMRLDEQTRYINRSEVIRQAVERGVRAMQGEFGVVG